MPDKRRKNCSIPAIEGVLVARCAKRNPQLINVHMNKKASWSIAGRQRGKRQAVSRCRDVL